MGSIKDQDNLRGGESEQNWSETKQQFRKFPLFCANRTNFFYFRDWILYLYHNIIPNEGYEFNQYYIYYNFYRINKLNTILKIIIIVNQCHTILNRLWKKT